MAAILSRGGGGGGVDELTINTISSNSIKPALIEYHWSWIYGLILGWAVGLLPTTLKNVPRGYFVLNWSIHIVHIVNNNKWIVIGI